LALTNIEVRHQGDYPGAMLLARDGQSYVHAYVPAEAFQDCFPGYALGQFDFEAYEVLVRSNLASLSPIIDRKYAAGLHEPFDRAGSTRPLVTVTADDLRDCGMSADVLLVQQGAGYRSR